jgi:hypothetical protein
VALPGLHVDGITFDAHTLVFSSLAILMGYQSVLFAICAKTFAINEGLLPRDSLFDQFFKVMYLERGLALGGFAFLAGLILLAVAIYQWKAVNFGRLDYAVTMRWVIPGATLAAIGFQTILSSFFVSMLGMKRRPGASPRGMQKRNLTPMRPSMTPLSRREFGFQEKTKIILPRAGSPGWRTVLLS